MRTWAARLAIGAAVVAACVLTLQGWRGLGDGFARYDRARAAEGAAEMRLAAAQIGEGASEALRVSDYIERLTR